MSEWLEPPYDPVEVDDVLIAFPAQVTHLMPDPETIDEDQLSWGIALQRDWFFLGLEHLDANWKEGIDYLTALDHLKCVQGSFQHKHEHKELAVAFLLEHWIDHQPEWKTINRKTEA